MLIDNNNDQMDNHHAHRHNNDKNDNIWLIEQVSEPEGQISRSLRTSCEKRVYPRCQRRNDRLGQTKR